MPDELFKYTKRYVFGYLRDINDALNRVEEIIDNMKPKRLKEPVKEELLLIRNRVSGIELWLEKDIEEADQP